MSYISSLTPLRGIAALLVLIYHYVSISVNTPQVKNSFQSQLFEQINLKGYLWVDFLFLLSGFIIFHVYGNSIFKKTNRIINWYSYWKFIKSRFVRIYPLHFFTLLILITYQGIIYFIKPEYCFTGKFSPEALVSNFFLLNAMGLNNDLSWNPVSWSIGAEFYTYLLALLILAGALNEGKFRQILNLKPFQFIGDISYSLYMVHGIVLIFVFSASIVSDGQVFWTGLSQLQLWLGLFSFTIISIVLSSVIYFKIENPLRKYLHKKVIDTP